MASERSNIERNGVTNDGRRHDARTRDAGGDPRSRDGRLLTRRRWLGLCGTATVPVLAGCTGGEDADEPADEPADDGTDGDDDGATGDDGETGDGDGDAMEDDDDEPEEDDDEEGGEEEEEAARFGDVIQFTEAFAFEWESTGEEMEWNQGSGRTDGENWYWRMETEGGEVTEMYIIDGDLYMIEGDECFLMPEREEEGEQEEVDTTTHEREAEQNPDLEPVGEDTIDGETVLVYELSPDESVTHDEEMTYYVSAETGYLRRIETETDVIDFHSWGDIDPIEEPDMDCMTMGEEEEGSYSRVPTPP